MLSGYYKNIVPTLVVGQVTVRKLSGYCQDIVRILSGYYKNIVLALVVGQVAVRKLLGYCQDIVLTLV